MTRKEHLSIISQLEEAHKAACENSNNPHETARLFIRAVGPEDAAQCMAAMIRQASWDGRISRQAKEWAASVTLSEEWEKRVPETYCDAIHKAHLSQIAEAMPAEMEVVAAETEEEEPDDPKTVTITVSPEDARLILRAINARQIHYCTAEVRNRLSNASAIRNMYRSVEDLISQQITAQGVIF